MTFIVLHPIFHVGSAQYVCHVKGANSSKGNAQVITYEITERYRVGK